MVNHGANVNATTIRGDSVLDLAIMRRHNDIVKCLVELGVDVNNVNGHTSLDLAKSRHLGEIVKYLKEHGAKDLDQLSKEVFLRTRI